MKDLSCCRGPVGGDMAFFNELDSILTRLEARGSDKVLMDMSVSTKKSIYARLLTQAERLSKLTGEEK